MAGFLPSAEAVGFHSYQPSIGIRQRLLLAEPRNAGDVVNVSERALISRGPFLVSGEPSAPAFAQGGIRPQRMERIRRVDSSSGSSWRLTTVLMVVVGATL